MIWIPPNQCPVPGKKLLSTEDFESHARAADETNVSPYLVLSLFFGDTGFEAA